MSDRYEGASFSRRALLAGAGASALTGVRVEAAAPLPVGFADGSGGDAVSLQSFCEASLGRPVRLVSFASMASLRDHIDAGVLAAAIVPRSLRGGSVVADVPPGPVPRATLLLGPPGPSRAGHLLLARHIPDPAADAVFQRLWSRHGRAGAAPRWLALAPAHLQANVAEGLLAAALVLGDVDPPAGCVAIRLPSEEARAISPRLTLSICGAFCGSLSDGP